MNNKDPENNNLTKAPSLDLSKLSTAQFFSLVKQVADGTPLFNLIKILATPVGIVALLLTLAYEIGGSRATQSPATHEQSTAKKESTPAPTASNSAAEPSASNPQAQQAIESMKSELEGQKAKAGQLQAKIEELQRELNRKPSYGTCVGYENEYNKLVNKKESLESSIQVLLNPNAYLTQQNRESGSHYSDEQLKIFAMQAAEQRKAAEDVQRQILANQELRKSCQ